MNRQRLDSYSLLLGLSALTTLLTGVIPSVSLTHYDMTVGFYDFIQFLPEYQSALAVISMSSVILTAVFAYIRAVPRSLCVILSAAGFLSSLITVLTLNIGVVYSKRAVTAAVTASESTANAFNGGLEYNFIIAVFLIDGLCALLLSILAALNERRASERRPAVLQGEAVKREQGFRPPDKL